MKVVAAIDFLKGSLTSLDAGNAIGQGIEVCVRPLADGGKGITPAMIPQMDKWLNNYAELATKTFPKANQNQAGIGAAGWALPS